MTARTVLISGASVAGPALAYWLARRGLHPVVIERADGLRLGGQNVDVRGAGREVARRMGIEGDIRAASTGERGLRFVDDAGRTCAEFPAGTADADSFTAELEILRGDLARILVERSRPHAEYIFGDVITGLRDEGDAITATFARGAPREFDLVIAADGVRSTTRALVLGDEPEVRELGLYMTYMTIPRAPSDDAWWRWYNAPGGRAVTLRPDNVGTTRATLTFMFEPPGLERLAPAEQREALRRVFAGAGWQAPRVLAALDDAADLYLDATAQVRAPRWSRGRFALVGDAAYCPSPITGMGTSLALVGAYVLAGELARHAHHGDAFAAYERVLRPYVERAQRLPPGAPRLAHPKTRTGVAALRLGLRLAALASRLTARVTLASSERFELPDYPEPPPR